MKLRIANVIEEGKLGGPQVRMVRVAAALNDRAETLIVMPRANSTPFREMCARHGVPYRVLPLSRITREWRAALAYALFSPWEVWRLVQLFRRERVDLVHASGGSWQVKAVIAARLAGIPSVWHLNDTLMPGWVHALFRRVAPWAGGFIYTSRRVRAYYGRYVGADRPFAFVPPPVDVHEFHPDAPCPGDEQAIARFGDGPVMVTVGNVNPIKGFETFIRAAARLRSLGHGVQAVIVGPIFDRQRAYHRRLMAQARNLGLDSIHFVGGRSDVRPFLARADVYVCPSLSESWGMALWEAMAMARPVVSTDVGDVARHVRDGEAGFIVPVGDDAAMAERIARLLDDPDRRARMGAAARETAMAFQPQEIAGLTLGIYQRVKENGASATDGKRS